MEAGAGSRSQGAEQRLRYAVRARAATPSAPWAESDSAAARQRAAGERRIVKLMSFSPPRMRG